MAAPYTLLIDSDHRFAEDLATILGGAGICLKAAATSAEALRLVKVHPPQLILIDLERPARESLRLLGDIEKLTRDVTYAWISSHLADEVIRRVRSTSAVGLIDRFSDTVTIVCAMRALLAGDRYFPSQHTNPATPTAKAEAESKRIIKLLHHFADQSEG